MTILATNSRDDSHRMRKVVGNAAGSLDGTIRPGSGPSAVHEWAERIAVPTFDFVTAPIDAMVEASLDLVSVAASAIRKMRHPETRSRRRAAGGLVGGWRGPRGTAAES